jgi:PAS domain S-box-containing protein
LLAIATIAGASGIVYASRGSLSEFSRSTVLLAGVMVAALGGIGPGLWATFLGVGAVAVLLLPPEMSLAFPLDDMVGVGLFASAGVLASVLSEGVRRAARREAMHAAHEALLESDHRFRELMEQAGDAIFVADLNGVYTDVNDGACRMLGYSRKELIGKRITDLIPPEDAKRLEHSKQGLLAGGEPALSEWSLLRRDGTRVPTEVSARILPDGRWQAIARDVSGRKQIEQDLIHAGMEAERARVEAEAARKTAEDASKAKDHFLAVLSHELRTPLTPVVTGVQLVESDPASFLSPDSRETLAMIRRNVDLETRLIDDLLDLTRVSRGKLVLSLGLVDVHAKIRNVVMMCESELKGKRLELALDLAARHHHANADAARLQQVCWNLLKNATKFTPEGGRIEIRSADGTGGRLRIEVSDTGIGIQPELLPRIFDAFEQGEKSISRNYGGLGLGLAISKALVSLHGGTIEAHSEGKDRGATFAIELDALELPAPVGAGLPDSDGRARAASGVSAVDRCLSILVVEDHPDTANALERLLKGAGHVVRTTDCVATALAAADSEEFDLLISDIGLPDGSGLDLMRQLLARKPIKGIVLSGFGMEEDVERSRAAGFLEHLTKPVNFARLRGAIEEIASR